MVTGLYCWCLNQPLLAKFGMRFGIKLAQVISMHIGHGHFG